MYGARKHKRWKKKPFRCTITSALPKNTEDGSDDVITVYRWETKVTIGDKECWFGPLSAHNYKPNHSHINDLVRSKMTCITSIEEEVPNFHSGMLCCSLDADDLSMWVDPRVAECLEENDYVISVYAVNDKDLYRGKCQAAFHKDHGQRVKSIDYTTFESEYVSDSISSQLRKDYLRKNNGYNYNA